MTTSSPLLDLLSPTYPPLSSSTHSNSKTAASYLTRLTSLPLATLQHDEATALDTAKHTLGLSLQALASRSHRALVASAEQLRGIEDCLKEIRASASELSGKKLEFELPVAEGEGDVDKKEVDKGSESKEETVVVEMGAAVEKPRTSLISLMDSSITSFISHYHRDSPLLQQRQTNETLHTQLPRLLDLLELPTLLSSALTNPPLALDILSHTRRLQTQHPSSKTIANLAATCSRLQKQLITSLITTLRGSLKLPLAIKTISYLRRTLPDLAAQPGGLEALFLVCRLHWISELFSALEPLKEAADEETKASEKGEKTGGQKTERYFKRWLEVFREQSFAVVSMYRSIFPNDVAAVEFASPVITTPSSTPSAFPFPPVAPVSTPPAKSPLQSFTLHLISLLESTIKQYLPNVTERTGREALLTQVLYAAGSLGRLGGDFGMLVAGENEADGEWVEVMKRQRVLAGRLEELKGTTA